MERMKYKVVKEHYTRFDTIHRNRIQTEGLKM